MDSDTITLTESQELALSVMLATKRFGLFWDVGKGKTYAILARLAAFSERKRVLILAPSVVISMWEKEKKADSFGVFAMHDVEYHSYEWLAWRKKEQRTTRTGRVVEVTTASHSHDLNYSNYDVVVLDEAHRMASPNTRSSRIIRGICKSSEYVYLLTGTPMRNGYQDLYYLFNNTGFDTWKDFSDYPSFVKHFFKYKMLRLPVGNIYKPLYILPNRKAEFDSVLIPYCMFGIKDRTWQFEPVHDIHIPATKIKPYFQALQGIIYDVNNNPTTTLPLVGIGRAYMILNGFQYVMDADGHNQTVEFFPNPKLGYLYKLLKYELATHQGVIVSYAFKRDFREIIKMLEEQGIAWVDNQKDAEAQTNKYVYLIHAHAGIGVNLQHLTSVIIFYTYTYSFVDNQQTIGRIDRPGQTNAVRIYRLIFSNSIETEAYITAIDTKQSLSEMLKHNSNDILGQISKEANSYGHE